MVENVTRILWLRGGGELSQEQSCSLYRVVVNLNPGVEFFHVLELVHLRRRAMYSPYVYFTESTVSRLQMISSSRANFIVL